MEFSYSGRPLGPNELRLLKVDAHDSSLLRVKILTVKRNTEPYIAVSYTWGDQDATETIYLDGQRFRVRPNLWSCLYYIGQYAQGTCLWVDAICIDQSNDSEKSSQVRLMEQTYREAASVSVWLGLIPISEEMLWRYRQPSSQTSAIKMAESDPFDWMLAIPVLANREYWSRFWVIQEFLLAQDVTLHCSNRAMNWLDFKGMLCREAGISEVTADYDGGQTESYSALPLIMARHVDKHPRFLQPLYDLVISHHTSQCKDPRDRIFALLGLIGTEERSLLERFFPDYSMTEDHVLIVALAHLSFQVSLRGSGEVISDSDEGLFLGLGIKSRERRRKLLRRAERLGYLHGYSRENVFSVLANVDEIAEVLEARESYPGSGDPGRINRGVQDWNLGQNDGYESAGTQVSRHWIAKSFGILVVVLLIWGGVSRRSANS